MKTTIVPAQVTTVEDKITGSLGTSQLLLLITPIFIGSVLFVVMPPFFSYAVYKVVLIVLLVAVFALLAIRIKGKILLLWLIVLWRYNARPKYYVYDKNYLHMRNDDKRQTFMNEDVSNVSDRNDEVLVPSMSIADAFKVEQLIMHPEANFRLEFNKKGRLSVHITEIQ
jgi:hypothetical protein